MSGDVISFVGVLLSPLVALIGGTAGAAIVNGINERKRMKMQHEYDEKEREKVNVHDKVVALERKTDAQSEAIMYMLFDRIRFLGRSYISAGVVDFDDRRMLHQMHRAYHDGLGGNGDLDLIMAAVDTLPLKTERSERYE